MTLRERRLAYIVLAFIVLAGGAFFGYQFYMAPMKAKTQQISDLQTEIDDLAFKRRKILAEKNRLDPLTRISLPHTPDTRQDASLTRRTEVASREYVEALNKMATASGFVAGSFGVIPKAPENKTVPTLVKNRPAYTRLDFIVDAKGDLLTLVGWLKRFYELRVLHQIKTMTFSRPVTPDRNRPFELEIKMNIEALVLDGAPQRKDLEPDQAPANLPPVLAPDREYERIAGKNIFFGPPPPPPRSAPTPQPDFVNASPYIKLDGVYRDAEGPVATLYDVFRDHHYTIRPRAAEDGFRVEVYFHIRGEKRPLRSSRDGAIELLDEEGKRILWWYVIKFLPDSSGLIIQDGITHKYYAFRLGQTLKEATGRDVEPLQKSDLQRFGVKSETKPDEAVKDKGPENPEKQQ